MEFLPHIIVVTLIVGVIIFARKKITSGQGGSGGGRDTDGPDTHQD